MNINLNVSSTSIIALETITRFQLYDTNDNLIFTSQSNLDSIDFEVDQTGDYYIQAQALDLGAPFGPSMRTDVLHIDVIIGSPVTLTVTLVYH